MTRRRLKGPELVSDAKTEEASVAERKRAHLSACRPEFLAGHSGVASLGLVPPERPVRKRSCIAELKHWEDLRGIWSHSLFT